MRTVAVLVTFAGKSNTPRLWEKAKTTAARSTVKKENPEVPLKKSLRIGTQNHKSIAIIQATLGEGKDIRHSTTKK